MEPLQSKMEQAEIQKYIDRYRHCPPEQLKKMLQEAAQFTPSQEQNLPLQYALVTLLEQTDKAPQEDPDAALSAFIAQHDLSGAAPPPKCWRRCMLIAAIITALLLFSAAAYAIQHYGLFLNIQETFTQPKTVPGPDALVASWTDTPVPTYAPNGFYINDAFDGDGQRFIEYANSEGKHYFVYFDTPESASYIDTEAADLHSGFELGGVTVHQVDKDMLCTLYWNVDLLVVSVEFCPEEIPLDEIKAVAESTFLPTQ